MRLLRILSAIVLPLLVGGCYTSEKPLVSADKAVFPYEKIVYTEAGQTDQQTMTHQGNAYVMKNDKGDQIGLLFMPVKGDYYVVQMGGKTDKGEAYLYGLVKLNADAKTADVYAMVADKSDIGPSLPACKDADSSICLTDLQPYIDHAMAMTGDGKKPAATYNLVELK
jgi:hypothetical protein